MIYDEQILEIVDIQFQQGLVWVTGRKKNCADVTVRDNSDVVIFGPDGQLIVSCPAGQAVEAPSTARHGGTLTVELSFVISAQRGEYMGEPRPRLRT